METIVHDVHVFAQVYQYSAIFQYIPQNLGSCTTMLQLRVPNKKPTTNQPNGEFFNIQLTSTENPQLIFKQLCASTTVQDGPRCENECFCNMVFIPTSELRYTGVPLYLKKDDVHLPFHHFKPN